MINKHDESKIMKTIIWSRDAINPLMDSLEKLLYTLP